MESYYKFMGLQNIKRFIEIVIHERLYAARYDELNDPMEGVFMIYPSNYSLIWNLKSKKDKTRICSLSKDYRHSLMWAHYADSHKGCCLKVISLSNKKPIEIKYDNDIITVVTETNSAEEILSHKSIIWKYEDEVRFFRKNRYLSVKILEVKFGLKVSKKDYNFFKTLINTINPEIVVSKMTEEELQTGYDNY